MNVLILTVVIGAAIGVVLGALGGGGGVLTVPALVYLLHEPPQSATTASLVIVGSAALTGIPAHAASGNVRLGSGAVLGGIGALAAVAGTLVGRTINGGVLLALFASVMAVSATMMFRNSVRAVRRGPEAPAASAGSARRAPGRVATQDAGCSRPVGVEEDGAATLVRPDTDTSRRASTGWVVLLAVPGGLLVGFLTGLLGIGGGFLAVPVLVVALRLPPRVAVGTSLVSIVVTTSVALLAHGTTSAIDWQVTVPVALAAMLFTFVGKRIADCLPGARLTQAFAVLLATLAVYTATRALLDTFS